MPYTPEQNGAAERENRTLVETARTMLLAKNLPQELWAEAVNTAAYILNRTGSTCIPDKSPFELWNGRKPVVDHLKIFGTECFVHIPKPKRSKWAKKGIKGYLVGYCHNRDGYRVWVPERNDVVCSHDVVFKPEKGISVAGSSSELERKSSSNPECEAEKSEQIEQIVAERKSRGANSEAEGSNQEENQIEQVEVESVQKDCNVYNLRDRTKLTSPDRYAAYAMFAEIKEPITVQEALNSPEASHWKIAMDEEMQSLLENETWTLVDLPANRKAITNRWIFKIKENPDKSIAKYKARLVVRGFSQKEGLDYDETFSPVVRFETIRTILAVVAIERLHLEQFDVKTAFLYGFLEEETYMYQPEEYADDTRRVCKLNRSLYGLKQAPRCWNHRLTQFLSSFGLKQSLADPCLFLRNSTDKLLVIFYVDDGLIAGSSEEIVFNFRNNLQKEFKITFGPVKNFLGVQILHEVGGNVFINQEGYARRVLERFHMTEAYPVAIPIRKDQISGREVADVKNLDENTPFRSAVGSLIYLTVATRPDIAFAVHHVSQSVSRPTIKDWDDLKTILKYLVGTLNYGILYTSRPVANENILEVYSDSDYAGDPNTRRSTSGVVSKYGGGAITWLSQKQKSVSLSTMEAEYIAASEAVKNMVWLKRLLREVCIEEVCSPVLKIDNASAIALVKNPEYHKRSKHIDVRYHFIREKYEEQDFSLQHVSGEVQVADAMTKALPRVRFQKLRQLLGVVPKEEYEVLGGVLK